jgi:DNA-binding GntR family transcriptional regulator
MEFIGLGRSLIDDIRSKAITGEYPPGSKINEINLASELGISRSPLREALRVLETERIIYNVSRKGSFVTDVSLEDLDEIYEIKEMTECFAIRLMKGKKITDLSKASSSVDLLLKMELPSKDDSRKEKLDYIKQMANFHLELVASAKNKQLFNFYRTIYSNINRYVFLFTVSEGGAKHRVEDHYAIIEYIEQNRYDDAIKFLKTHIRNARKEISIRMQKELTEG